MARPTPNSNAKQFKASSSPWIDADGDILVSSASTSSSEVDSSLDPTEKSATSPKIPQAYSKGQAAPSTSYLPPDAGTSRLEKHTAPTLNSAPRTTAEKPEFDAVSFTKPQQRDVPFAVDTMLDHAIRGAKPLLVAIFGEGIIAPLKEIARNLPANLLVSDGESSIKFQVKWTAAALRISSKPGYEALKKAAAMIQDRSDWDRIIMEAKQTLDPKKFKPTKLGNAEISCKAVFRLLQMLRNSSQGKASPATDTIRSRPGRSRRCGCGPPAPQV